MKITKYYIGGPLIAEIERQGLKLHVFCHDNHLSTNLVYAASHNEPTTGKLLRRLSAALNVSAESLISDRIEVECVSTGRGEQPKCGRAFVMRLVGDDYLDSASSAPATSKVYPMAHRMMDGKYVQA